MAKVTVAYPGGLTFNESQLVDILSYAKERLQFGEHYRDINIGRYTAIDKLYHGHRVLSQDDVERLRETLSGRGFRPIQPNVAFGASHIHDIAVNVITMFIESIGLFQSTEGGPDAHVIKAFVKRMNQNVAEFNHVQVLVKFVIQALKYNRAGMGIDWVEENGRVVDKESYAGAGNQFTNGVTKRGNCLYNMNPYNTIIDPTVPCYEVPAKGEFAAHVKLLPEYALRRMHYTGEIINLDNFIGEGMCTGREFYEPTPQISNVILDGGSTGSPTNWKNDLADDGSSHHMNDAMQKSFEYIDYYGWFPRQLISYGRKKKVDSDIKRRENSDMAMVRLSIIGGEKIVAIEELNYEHKMLPCVFAQPSTETDGLSCRSVFEVIEPIQSIMNAKLTTAVETDREALQDMIFVRRSAVGNNVKAEQIARQRVVIVNDKFAAKDGISSAVSVFQHKRIDNTMEEINELKEIMEILAPGGQVNNLVDLDRATEYQTSAVVQSSSKRNYAIALVIQDQALRYSTFMQVWNFMQYEETIEVPGENGEVQQINTGQLGALGLHHKIGEGLEGLDRLRKMKFWDNMMRWILQNAQAIQQIDIIKLLDHISNLVGDTRDVTQFRIQVAIDSLPPEQRQRAYDLLLAEQNGELAAQTGETVVQ